MAALDEVAPVIRARPEDDADARRRLAETVTFLMLGAQKAGTSWWAGMLRTHPDVFFTQPKEAQFFNNVINRARGLEWYLDCYTGSDGATARGEGTPGYFWSACTAHEAGDPLFHHDIPEDVAGLLPDIKLLVALRDPVDRAVSGYLHHQTRGNFAPRQRLRDVIDQRGVVSIGWYDRQFEAWLKHYPIERFLILVYEEDIKPSDAKPRTMSRTFEHLGVGPMAAAPQLDKRVNAGLDHTLAHLRQFGFFRDTDVGRRLAKRINQHTPAWVQRALEIKVEPADLDALKDAFRPHNERLSALLGRPLPWDY